MVAVVGAMGEFVGAVTGEGFVGEVKTRLAIVVMGLAVDVVVLAVVVVGLAVVLEAIDVPVDTEYDKVDGVGVNLMTVIVVKLLLNMRAFSPVLQLQAGSLRSQQKEGSPSVLTGHGSSAQGPFKFMSSCSYS